VQIINKYKMRENVRNFNLAGMGCSAGVVSVDLAKDLLKAHPNSTVVIVSTENITQNWYRSNERVRASAPRGEFTKAGESVDWRRWRISLLAHPQDMIVSNCLFRLGGAAILLSNKRKDARRAKYQLLHTVRVHKVRRRERHHLACLQVDLLTRLSPLSEHLRLSRAARTRPTSPCSRRRIRAASWVCACPRVRTRELPCIRRGSVALTQICLLL